MRASSKYKFYIKLRNIISMIAVFTLSSLLSFGQDSTKEYKGYVLSSVVIADLNKGVDMDNFIDRVQNDSTFYKAFKTLSLVSCTQYNDIRFFDKNQNKIAFYEGISRQIYDGKCRTMSNSNEKYSKKYFKKKTSLD